ncbi:MAG TPA: wax ester/triacylglycerol synthase family O-acyltransferase [Nocardioidaceae bacterium]|nr:wax ester/triacylglycerol synthase family O-acyltransferase [Nocardioidaceae bacterium]
MLERVRPDDLALLAEESASLPLHNATLEMFEPDRQLDLDRLIALAADRIAFVPRYRQRVLRVPGRLAGPVWVDDDDFDLTYHVRRSALPRPGSMEQLRELTGRIMSRRLDGNRPLWEMYLIEGLEGGRFAVLVKSHQVLVDGVATIDLGQVLLDLDPAPRETVHEDWRPRPAPGPPALVAGAVRDAVRDPRVAVATLASNARSVARTAGAVGGRAVELAAALTNRPPVSESPFHARLCEQRRFVTVKSALGDYRAVRRFHGGTVNDVVLATVTGALRSWLMTRAEPVPSSRSVRAMVPMSVLDSDLEPTSLGSQVVGTLLNLPIGETSPVVRLHQVSYALKAHKETGRAVAADRLAGVSGFAPTTFHALGSRVAMSQARRGFDLVVTNVPGPQFPLYAAGARMSESYPAQPLLAGHPLAVGITSYDGAVYYGLTGDRDAVPDLDVLGQCVRESLEELVDSTSPSRPRAPRGRRSAGTATRGAAGS